MFQDVPRFPGGGVQPVQACHQLGAGRHPRRLGQPSSGDPNLGGALGSDPNPGPSRFYLYFWEKIFYIFRYLLYIYMCDSKIFSPHHGQNQWLLIGCFSIRPGRQPAATRDGCSALRAAQVLGRFGSFQRAIGFHVHPGEGRMVKDGEGWWRDIDSLALQYMYIYIYQQYINIYQHIVGCWMKYIDYIGGYIGWWTIWSLFFGDGVEIRLQRGCPFQATECQDLIVENLIVTPFSCSG